MRNKTLSQAENEKNGEKKGAGSTQFLRDKCQAKNLKNMKKREGVGQMPMRMKIHTGAAHGNANSHWLNLYGLSPVCVLTCARKLPVPMAA